MDQIAAIKRSADKLFENHDNVLNNHISWVLSYDATIDMVKNVRSYFSSQNQKQPDVSMGTVLMYWESAYKLTNAETEENIMKLTQELINKFKIKPRCWKHQVYVKMDKSFSNLVSQILGLNSEDGDPKKNKKRYTPSYGELTSPLGLISKDEQNEIDDEWTCNAFDYSTTIQGDIRIYTGKLRECDELLDIDNNGKELIDVIAGACKHEFGDRFDAKVAENMAKKVVKPYEKNWNFGFPKFKNIREEYDGCLEGLGDYSDGKKTINDISVQLFGYEYSVVLHKDKDKANVVIRESIPELNDLIDAESRKLQELTDEYSLYANLCICMCVLQTVIELIRASGPYIGDVKKDSTKGLSDKYPFVVRLTEDTAKSRGVSSEIFDVWCANGYVATQQHKLTDGAITIINDYSKRRAHETLQHSDALREYVAKTTGITDLTDSDIKDKYIDFISEDKGAREIYEQYERDINNLTERCAWKESDKNLDNAIDNIARLHVAGFQQFYDQSTINRAFRKVVGDAIK